MLVGSSLIGFMERRVMENIVVGISESTAFGVFSFSAIVCLGLSFLIVCLVHPLGNKLPQGIHSPQSRIYNQSGG